MDLSRLIKLLNLTTSDNDGETLNAIRAANAWLKKNTLSWPVVLSTTKSTTNHLDDIFRPKTAADAHLSPLMIQLCMDRALETANMIDFDFLIGIQRQYEKRGYLSDKQRERLNKIWKKNHKE